MNTSETADAIASAIMNLEEAVAEATLAQVALVASPLNEKALAYRDATKKAVEARRAEAMILAWGAKA